MATRHDYQIAVDVCRFGNIINDLLDVMSYWLHNLDPNTGDVLQIQEPPAQLNDPPVYRDATVEDIKAMVQTEVNSIQNYYAAWNQFFDALGGTRIQEALNAWNINAQDMKDDILGMRDVAIVAHNNISTVTTFAELDNGGTYIDNNVPKLPLFRRRWDL